MDLRRVGALTRRSLLALGGAFALAGVGALAGCRTPAPRSGVPALTFVHLAPIPLQVAQRAFENRYAPPPGTPTIEAGAPIAPVDAVRGWAEQRIVPVGANGVATVIVHDAMLAEIPLARTTGITGFFTDDQSEEYRVRIDVEVTAYGLPNTTGVAARAYAERTRTVAEDITLQQRDEVTYGLVEQVMIDLNAELESRIYEGFGPYLA